MIRSGSAFADRALHQKIAFAAVWALSAPFWHWFIQKGMAAENADSILRIVCPSVVFYLAYIPSAFIDGWFVSKGKTWCLAVISAAVNLVYYGILYGLFRRGVFEASMAFVIRMFGWGMVVHLLLSVILYAAVQNAQRAGRDTGCRTQEYGIRDERE